MHYLGKERKFWVKLWEDVCHHFRSIFQFLGFYSPWMYHYLFADELQKTNIAIEQHKFLFQAFVFCNKKQKKSSHNWEVLFTLGCPCGMNHSTEKHCKLSISCLKIECVAKQSKLDLRAPSCLLSTHTTQAEVRCQSFKTNSTWHHHYLHATSAHRYFWLLLHLHSPHYLQVFT